MEECVAWFKVDDGFFAHPKVRKLSLEAIAVWMLAGTWSAFYLTDGVIDSNDLDLFRGTSKIADELVAAGLWYKHEDGWMFKEWDRYQPVKAVVEKNRIETAERMRLARENKAAKAVAVVNDADFDAFWKAYPLKVGKPKARSAYINARKRTDHDTIIVGLNRVKSSWGVGYEPHPTTWLNRDGWDDQVRSAPAPEKSRYQKNLKVVQELAEMEQQNADDGNGSGQAPYGAIGA